MFLGIANALIGNVAVRMYGRVVSARQLQKGCLLSPAMAIAHSDNMQSQLYGQIFTAFLSTLVLLATVGMLLAATYRSPQSEALVRVLLRNHLHRVFRACAMPSHAHHSACSSTDSIEVGTFVGSWTIFIFHITIKADLAL